MRTISHTMPDLAAGDFSCLCSYCGVLYYRSELVLDQSGLLACERDRGGDVVALSMENAERSTGRESAEIRDGGATDSPITDTPPAIVQPDGVVGF